MVPGQVMLPGANVTVRKKIPPFEDYRRIR